jgi:hypothetical protein
MVNLCAAAPVLFEIVMNRTVLVMTYSQGVLLLKKGSAPLP